ncbi:hypothetical protein LMG29542_08639 [Paraburkholderia humisilvae]|uniref:Uncharacterized protein n=1 Tax=Paraburkholderia humisilvae TaxID=627669 RepID=A0A6J5FCT0_9BURK|nr:hypothetical protein LMG29542_08639 [Paraburkholderia humisilvae]
MPDGSEATVVDSEPTAVLVAYSCEPLTASVLVPSTWPGATLVTCRSFPAVPKLTTPLALPAYVYAVPAIVPPVTGTAAVVASELAPRAIELATDAVALVPSAIALFALAVANTPSA